MNPRRVVHILGLVLFVLATAQLLPLLWCLAPLDLRSAAGLGAGAATAAILGGAFRLWGHEEGDLYRRDGVLVVVGAWGLASLCGAVPYLVSGAIPGFVDALFESVSGFTTTGASILPDVEALPRPILFWRSLSQWLGGIGIVVLFVALLSELGPGARFLFKLEVPGPKAEILHSRVRATAVALFRIYLGLSAIQAAVMLVLGASLYDALTHTFSTVSTGGFSPYAASVDHFPPVLQAVVLVFMLASGVNFALYFLLLSGRNASILRDVELRTYLAVFVVATAVVALDVLLSSATLHGFGHTLLDAAFQVASIVTTTGFATADFNRWPGLAQAVLLALMFTGACAGSTSGGMKLIRLLIGWRVAMREIRLTFSPNAVIAIVVGRAPVPESSARAVTALLLLWVLGWGIGALLLSVGDTDIVTASTASLATVSNIGPGLGDVGPLGNFAGFANWQKLVMVLLMWLGRLEFFAILALFQPRFWRR